MGENPLDRFRRSIDPAPITGHDHRGSTLIAYEAFRVANKRQLRLKICPALRAWERMHYGYLLRIVEDGLYGTELALVFTFSVVVIKGRNLQPIAEAIDAEACEFIQQYDPARWQTPTDATAPFIEDIAIHVHTEMVKAADKVLMDIDEIQRNLSM